MLRTIPRKERARNIIMYNLHLMASENVWHKCKRCPHGIGAANCQKCDEWLWERARLFVSDIVIRRLRRLYTPAKLDDLGYVAAHAGVEFCKKKKHGNVC